MIAASPTGNSIGALSGIDNIDNVVIMAHCCEEFAPQEVTLPRPGRRIDVDKKWFESRWLALGLTQNELARRVGLDRGALSRALNGGRHFKFAELKKIATVLNVPIVEVSEHIREPAAEVQTKRSSQSADAYHPGFMEEQVESKDAVDRNGETPGFGESPQAEIERPVRRHPLLGRLKGVITLAPGVDLTEPADPDLADYLDRKYGPEVRD